MSVLDAESAGDEPIALPVVEAVPREEEFYDYESRYEIGMTTFVCPAELAPETTKLAQELALETYKLLGCHGVARVDLMLDADTGELSVLETNVVPGLTETSLLPQASDAAGHRLRRARRANPRQRLHTLSERQESPAAKSSGETWSRNSLNFSTTSSDSSTSCSNSIADSEMTSSAA